MCSPARSWQMLTDTLGTPLLLYSPPSPLKVPCISPGGPCWLCSSWEGVFVQEVDGDGSALQQLCSVIRPREGSSSGQGTTSLFSVCKFLLAEGSVSRAWYRTDNMNPETPVHPAMFIRAFHTLPFLALFSPSFLLS